MKKLLATLATTLCLTLSPLATADPYFIWGLQSFSKAEQGTGAREALSALSAMDITLEPPFTELPKYCQWSIVYVLYFLEATHAGPFYTTNATGFFPGISNYPGWPHRENFEDIGPSERHVYDGEPWGHEEHGPLDWVDKYWVPVGYGEIDARRPGGNNSGWKNLEVWESLVGETPRPYDELVTEYLEDFWYMLVQGTCPEALEPEAQ